MNLRLLVKRLLVASLILALALAGYAFSFVNVFELGKGDPLIASLLVAIRSFVIGLINIGGLVFAYRYYSRSSRRSQKIIRYLTSAGVSVVLFIALDPFIYVYTHRGYRPWHLAEQWASILLQTSLNYILITAFHEVVILNYENSATLIENSELKAARAESAYLLLRQQTHPHFLFNALSMMRSLYKRDVSAGDSYLTHLVNFLRASLTDSQAKLSPVKDEIALCNDYIAMQKIRFDSALNCEISVPEDVLRKGAVPAFSVQSLIENAIKHNEVTDYSPLFIKIYYEDGRLITENNVQPKSFIDTPSRKGLANLMERYRLISGEKVLIHQENGIFSVSIKVLQYEDRNN